MKRPEPKMPDRNTDDPNRRKRCKHCQLAIKPNFHSRDKLYCGVVASDGESRSVRARDFACRRFLDKVPF